MALVENPPTTRPATSSEAPPEAAPTPAPEALERLDAAARQDHQATQHLVRYDWASRFTRGRRVLDCASGLGYGSAILSDRGAREVVGVELSPDAVAYARGKHARANVKYFAGDGQRLHSSDAAPDLGPGATLGRFGAIVCLETLEHFDDPRAALDGFAALLEPDGVLLVSVPNDLGMGVTNPFHRWKAGFDEVLGWLRSRFGHVDSYAQVHAVGSSVVPGALLCEESTTPTPATVRTLGSAPIDRASGFLFACRLSSTVAGVRGDDGANETSVCFLPEGFAYVRNLEASRDAAVAEAQRLAGEWAAISESLRISRSTSASGENLAAAVAERDNAVAEAQRLAAEWSGVAGSFQSVREAHDRLYAEAQALVQERDRAIAEAARLANEWQAVKSQLDELRGQPSLADQFGKVSAERDSHATEARRLSTEWAAISEELRACKRKLDIADGDKLLLGAKMREIETRLAQAQAACDGLRGQPLYRFMCRVGLLKPLEAPHGRPR